MKCKILYTIALLLVIVACERDPEKVTVDVDSAKTTVLHANIIEELSMTRISNFSMLQSIGKSLFITLPRSQNDTLIYEWNANQKFLKGSYRSGRGPGEVLQVFASSRCPVEQQLYFFCRSNAKILLHHSDGGFSELTLPHSLYSFNGISFASSGEHIAFNITSQGADDNKLLAIYHTKTGAISYSINTRIPFGYEPSSRNLFSALAGTPEGFVFAFLGDKELIFLDHSGNIGKILKLGDNDLIPEPYIPAVGQRRLGAQPYIAKIEYANELLYVLFNGEIYIVNANNGRLTDKLDIVNNSSESIKPILDFTISDGVLYLRALGNEIYWIDSLTL